MTTPYTYSEGVDPRWFFEAVYTDGTRLTFWNDSKALAEDHAWYVGRTAGKTVQQVTRLKHAKDITPAEAAAAGSFR